MEDKKNNEYSETDDQKAKFLELHASLKYHIGKTCTKIGVHRNTFLYWKKTDSEFLDKYKALLECKIDDSEERLYLLSQGIPKKDDKGNWIGWEVRPHFQALQLQLKAQAKDRGYGDHIVIDDKRTDHNEKSEEELMREIEAVKQRYTDYEPNDGEQEEDD